MDADRHVQLLSELVQREEVWVAQDALTLEPAKHDSAGSVVLAPTNLVQRLTYIEDARDRDPPKPSFSLAPDIGEPPVIASAHRHVDLRPRADLAQRHR